MRRIMMLGVFVVVFAMSGTTALANENDGRIGRADPPVTTNPLADGVPCYGLYVAGVGYPPNPGGSNPFGRTVDTPGFEHVDENDDEMCHPPQ
jgi:hypothetical protein